MHESISYANFLEITKNYKDLWLSTSVRAHVSDETINHARSLRKRLKLVAIVEDWCIDAIGSVPYIAHLVEQVEGWELEIVLRDKNLDFMDRYLSITGARSIPVVIIQDEQGNDLGKWGPRPKVLQMWFDTEARKMEPAEKYKEARKWYARDKGKECIQELLSIIEGV